MKLVLPVAYISAVTNLMLAMGTGEDASQVPATALKLEAEVDPTMLEQLREGLTEKFFDVPEKGPPVPSIPELEALGWKTEYQGGKIELDLTDAGDLDFDENELVFTGVEMKSIVFEPLSSGMVKFTANAIVRADESGRGKLAGLLKHTVRATFTKLTQKPLAEPKKPKDDAAQAQGSLPIEAPPTADGEPIVPLMH